MNTVERVKKICKERKIPISKLEKDLGFGNGYIGQLKKGVFPDDRLALISDYLNLSIKYLLTGEKEAPAAQMGDGLAGKIAALDADLQKRLIDFVALAEENPETAKRFLLFAVQEIQSASQGH